MGMRQRQRWTVLAFALAAFAFLAASLAAKQSAPLSATKSLVPDNPSPHPEPTQPIPYSHKNILRLD